VSEESATYHWTEGMKYALEGIKLLFILNGASAVSILTFIGNAQASSRQLIISLVFFAMGAVSAVLTMVFAYLVQLHYGNAKQDEAASGTSWAVGARLHLCAYVFTVLGITFFFIGVCCTADGLASEPLKFQK